MEKIIEFKNVSFKYPTGDNFTLSDITFDIFKGEMIAICGKSGCGKTTLLKHIKSSLKPEGKRTGEILFNGQDVLTVDSRISAEKIGYVGQNVEAQCVTDKVWHEIAFTLESLGYDNETIRRKVSEISSFLGIEKWFYKEVSTLSGGQKQILNLASVMVAEPEVLILDEPTSQLSPVSAEQFLSVISKINREMGTTVIIIEQRLQDILPMCDRMAIMDGGRILKYGEVKECADWLKENKNGMFLAMPTPLRVWAAIDNDFKCPMTVGEGRVWLNEVSKERSVTDTLIREYDNTNENIIILKNVYFKYEKNGEDVIKDLSLNVKKGDIYAILGSNGVGKSTALSLISGINKPYRGDVKIKEKNIAYVPQDVKTLFVKNTVYEELLNAAKSNTELDNVINLCKLSELLTSHPYDLSGGEQQRLALSLILLKNPEVLLLDEPTKGLDAEFKSEMAEILYKLKISGKTVIIVSHDMEFCAEYADIISMFFDGSVVSTGTPQVFFTKNSFYNTEAGRMSKNIIENAVTVNDIIKSLGGMEENYREKQQDNNIFKSHGNPVKEHKSLFHKLFRETKLAKLNGKFKFENIAVTIITFLVIFLTVIFGNSFTFGKKYYIISLLIIFEAIIPVFFLYERKKPKARELVTIATLCAIAVMSRSVFYMLPQVKPIVAIVLVSGISLGSNIGFLTGSMSAFLSNFLFGQGPWTPWQMIALGLVGFLGGAIFNIIKCRRISVCITGAVLTYFVYGIIVNLSNVFLQHDSIVFESAIIAIISALPFDIIHTVSVTVILWLIAEPMLEKLERVKIKYGLIQGEN